MSGVAIGAPTRASKERVFSCHFGRVSGAGKDNKAIITGSHLVTITISSARSQPALIRVDDPDHLVTVKTALKLASKPDGSLTVFSSFENGWRAVIGFDALKTGASTRDAQIMKLGTAEGSVDLDHFYYGTCSETAGELAMQEQQAEKS